jgi:hypothetical protein
MRATEILKKAADAVGGPRQKYHGDIKESFNMISNLWSIYLDAPITPVDVARCMEMIKIARGKVGEMNIDDYIDGAGYSAIAGQLSFSMERIDGRREGQTKTGE